jgi:hypothetical protein
MSAPALFSEIIMTQLSRLLFVLLVTISPFTTVFADGGAPNWLKQAAAQQTATYTKDVPGVVMQDSQEVTLDGENRLVTTENYAVKILTREGRGLAAAHAFYLMSFSRVRDINAWVIRPDGTIKEYDKKSVLDVIADQDDVYNEGRVKIIDASGDVDAGYVFGYRIVTEDKTAFLPGQSRVSGATAGDDFALYAQFAGRLEGIERGRSITRKSSRKSTAPATSGNCAI